MCGIAGFWGDGATRDVSEAQLHAMTSCIAHRGPDDAGVWADADAGIALGHRRLSILDLTPEGHQPMASATGRFVMSFNGEVYNFAVLREQLVRTGASFRGHSDTEVMLAAFEHWGIAPALQRMAGMFAIALWDRRERELHLVRDRLGEKPLYFGWMGRTLLFGSELKALRAHPAWRGEISRGALALFLRHNYVPAPYSIYAGIAKVQPGTIVTFREGAIGAPGEVTTFWSARAVAEQGMADPMSGSPGDILDALEATLSHTIGEEMMADVPLGAFLSGGIDSSLIVALMQAQSASPVRTFTIGFHEHGYDEAQQAKAVAAHLGTDHTELYVSPRDLLDVVPRLPQLYDEPFADSSQVPTFLVAQLARSAVTVSLSGDGGDELFGGYYRYFWGDRLWNRMRRVPLPVRSMLSRGIRAIPTSGWDRVAAAVGPLMPAGLRVAQPGDRMHKAAGLLSNESAEGVYLDLVSHWRDPARVVLGGVEPATRLRDPAAWPVGAGFVPQMMYLDLMTYLPDDILVKVDRAAMGVSLETRAPFLDHRVVEFAWRVPHELKVRDGQGKWLLKQLLYRHVPQALVDRPKMGFGIPLGGWLRGELRDWGAALLDPTRVRAEGYFDADVVWSTWEQHQRGSHNWQYLLWDVLMFQAWLEAQ